MAARLRELVKGRNPLQPDWPVCLYLYKVRQSPPPPSQPVAGLMRPEILTGTMPQTSSGGFGAAAALPSVDSILELPDPCLAMEVEAHESLDFQADFFGL